MGKQAALQNHWFYSIDGYIWALERGLGGPWGGEVEANTGGDELHGDRGAHKNIKTKRAGADEEKKGPQGYLRGTTRIDLGPPLGRSVRFTCIKPMFSLVYLGCSKVLLGGSWGGLGGPKAHPRGSWGTPWGARAVLGGPLGDLGAALGGRGAPSKSTSGKQAALQNHWFYYIKWYILALRGVAGGP